MTLRNIFIKVLLAALVSALSINSIACSGVTASVGVSHTSTGVTTVSVGISIKIDPSGSDLASFDPRQALENLALTNLTLTSTSGTANVVATDDSTGTVIGQATFAYYTSGSSIYLSDPSAVHQWLLQFQNYSNVGLAITNSVSTTIQDTSSNSSATASTQYRGTSYASGSDTWGSGGDGGRPCNPKCA